MNVSSSVEYIDENHIYFNCIMANPGPRAVPAVCSQSRTSPLLTDPSKWYLSVIRFDVPGRDIPINIVYADPFPNTNVNQLIYTVTLTRNGTTSGPVNLIWNGPEYNTVFKPQVPVFTAQQPRQLVTDPYYFNNNYSRFVRLINTALATAYAALPDKGSTTQPPYITFDPVTDLMTMWAQQSYQQNTTNPLDPSNVLIWFNNQLFDYMPSFNAIFNGYVPPVVGQDWAIPIINTYNNSGTGATGGAYYLMVQDYSSLFSWNSLQNLSFRSNSLPISFENSTGVDSNGQLLEGSASGNQIAILTDFEPIDNGTPGIFKESIQYFPFGEYRLIDMLGNVPITQIQLQVYWTDTKGVVHPLYIPPNNLLSFKILFRRKSFYGARGAIRPY